MGRGKKKLKEAPKEEDNILKLPSHITIEILSRVPAVKTIAHCACVCKAWRTLLLDPSAGFPQLHLSKSPVSLLLFTSHSCCLIEFDKDFRKRMVSKFKEEHVFSGFPLVVGSCNGLLCLDVANALYVWNPVKNDCIALPVLNIKPRYIGLAAFGFCQKTNVYKVIRTVHYSDEAPIPMMSRNKAMCKVYTLGSSNARWRTIEDVPIPFMALNFMMLNGAVHWFGHYIINDYKFPLWICAFRIEDEKWDPILLPLSLLEGLDFRFSSPARWLEVAVLENCLSIFDKSQRSVLNIWMMKDYGVSESWTKRWSIEQTQISSQIPVDALLPLKLTNDGELLMFDYYNPTLVCFDPQKRLITRKQKIFGVGKNVDYSMAYVASFVSPTQVMNEE